MATVLITQCLQRDFVDPIGPHDPLPNLLHVGYSEATRLLGPERVEAIRAAARDSNGDMVTVRRRLPFPAALAEIRLALTVA